MNETGQASIRIEPVAGHIQVTHGEDPDDLLAELRNAPPGTWLRLWEALEQLGIKEVGHD